MITEQIKAYFEEKGLGDRVVTREQIIDTVEHAAQAIGCEERQIAKTMSFLVKGEPILIVMAGDAKVQNGKFKRFFHEKATMIPWDDVEEKTGHTPGAVCPFALKEGVCVYLDESLKRFPVVYAAGGDVYTTVGLSPDELERYSGSRGWIDVCKDWQAEE